MAGLRKTAAVILIMFCLWLMLPLAKGILHFGMIYPVVILLPLILCLLKPQLLKDKGIKKAVAVILICCYSVGFLLCGATLLMMARAAQNTAEDETTVVVLGCMVYGTRPSRVLTDRCEAACDYLKEHPAAVCIASGGQGTGEDITEARAIYTLLTENGIEPERIYLEEQSENTEENMLYSAELIKEKGFSEHIAAATDSFHEFRAKIYAQRAGLEAAALPSATYLFVAPGYWLREIPALWVTFIK